MPRKKKTVRDARGYGQTGGGPSASQRGAQQQSQSQPMMKKSASSVSSSSDAAIRAVPVTASTQQDLETLLETLLQINDNNSSGATSHHTATSTSVPSDRFRKRVSTIYDRLLGYGFTVDQMQQAIVAEQYDITLESALDWLCLHLGTQDLPPLFTEGVVREAETAAVTDSNGDSLTVVAAAVRSLNSGGTQDTRVVHTESFIVKEKDESETEPLASKEDDESKAEQKAWLLQQYEYVDEDEAAVDEAGGGNGKAKAVTNNVQPAVSKPSAFESDQVESVKPSPSASDDGERVVAEPTIEELQLQSLEQELRLCEADLKDEAANYMRSKYEIKELKGRTKSLGKQVQGARRKVERQKAVAVPQETELAKALDPEAMAEAEAAGEDEGVEADTGGLFGMFDEEEVESSAPPTPAKPEPSVTFSEGVKEPSVDIPKDSIPKSWTGQTPRKYLLDWCRKEKLHRPTYQKLPRNGCSIRVKLKSSVVFLEERGSHPSYVDTQEYVATKALYQMNPELPLYRLFPPFHRDLWRSWMDQGKMEKESMQQEVNDQRLESIDMLIKSIPEVQPPPIKPLAKSAVAKDDPKSARNAAPVLESWDDFVEVEAVSWEDQDDDLAPLPTTLKSDTRPNAADERLKKNFLRHRSTDQYREMMQARASLPMHSYREEILSTVRQNPVTILFAETGAGKTTQCPQFILEQALVDGKGSQTSILCTQPRRVAAMSVAERVADEMCDELGKLVGYQIRLEARRSAATRLLFCTTGIILRRLVEDPELRGISHVVVDEVHERQWQIDVLLVALRSLLNGARPDLKVILMSATLDAKLFTSFFNGAPLVSVPGRTFPVATYYLEDLLDATDHIIEEGSRYARRQRDDRETASMWVSTRGGEKRRETVSLDSELVDGVSDEFAGYKMSTRRSMGRVDETSINYDLIEDTLRLILVHYDPDCGLVPPNGANLSGGAVLVFLPGIGEIRTLTERLQGSRLFGKQQFEIVPLHSTLSSTDQRRAFQPARSGCRKIIISTNIAETSVTIPDVVCVIDSGRVREVQRDKRTSTSKLLMEWCSRASGKQRAGRAGRVQSGICLKLFSSRTEKHYMKTATEPELRRIPLEEVCLNILAAGFAKSCMDFLSQTPQPPTPDAVRSAVNVLSEIGAVSVSVVDGSLAASTEELTPLGLHLARLPVDARVGKMLIFGALFRCIDSIATIAASLSASQSVFASSLYETPEAKAARLSFADPQSDFMSFVNVWEAYRKCGSPGQARKFCKERFLNMRALREIGDARSLYLDLLSGLGFLDKKKLGYDQRRRQYDDNLVASSLYNANGKKEDVVHAVVCGGTYPNIARFDTTPGGDRSLWHKQERLFVHSSSVNAKTTAHLPSTWIAFHEKFGTANRVSVSTTCFVHPFALMLFGGSIVVKHTERKVCLDEWIEVGMAAKTGVMFRELRKQVDHLLKAVIEDTDSSSSKSATREMEATKMVNGIVQLIASGSV